VNLPNWRYYEAFFLFSLLSRRLWGRFMHVSP